MSSGPNPRLRLRPGVVLLEVMIGLAVFALGGTALALALRQAGRLQAGVDAEIRLERALENTAAEVRAMPELQPGLVPLPSADPAIELQVEVVDISTEVSDQFGQPLGTPPPQADDPESPSGAASPAEALPVPPLIYEVTISAREANPDGPPPEPRTVSFWLLADSSSQPSVANPDQNATIP